jgi:hypothetical protein
LTCSRSMMCRYANAAVGPEYLAHPTVRRASGVINTLHCEPITHWNPACGAMIARMAVGGPRSLPSLAWRSHSAFAAQHRPQQSQTVHRAACSPEKRTRELTVQHIVFVRVPRAGVRREPHARVEAHAVGARHLRLPPGSRSIWREREVGGCTRQEFVRLRARLRFLLCAMFNAAGCECPTSAGCHL